MNTGTAAPASITTHRTFFYTARLLMGLFLTATVFLLAPTQSSAETTVKVLSLGTGSADLMINGWVLRRMREGQTSPEGVKLISATKEAAEIEVNGKRLKLRTGQALNATVTLHADQQGHFFTTIKVNGHSTQALVDTGASSVTINSADAKRMGIDYGRGLKMISSTANGDIAVRRVTLSTVQVGDIVLRNVEATVVEGGTEKLRQALLGMSFLSQTDMQRTGSTLTIMKRE